MVFCTTFDTDEFDRFHCAPPRQLVAVNANSNLDRLCQLDINSSPAPLRLTSIMCTIGPSSTEIPVLEKLMEAGMNIARVRCFHSKREVIIHKIENIRKAADNCSKRLGVMFPVAIALTIAGPEIHTGFIEGGLLAEVELKKGEQIKLTTDKAYYERGSDKVVYVDYDNIHTLVHVGSLIYVDDGLISLICVNVQGSVVTCTIENGGMLGSCRRVNVLGVEVEYPTVTERDKQNILLGIEMGVDMIFASYVRTPANITSIRSILGTKGKKILVVAIIETVQSLKNLDEIIKIADGILLGRGDLSIEVSPQKLFLAQKKVFAKCNKAGIPVICANQMLASMTNKLLPTRAESNDVANAILDGADVVSLTGETARGEYPVETVITMAQICKEAEAAYWHKKHFHELVSTVSPPLDPSQAIAIAAVEAATKCLAAAILVVTTSGKSAALVAKYRPNCPIVGITRSEIAARQLNLRRGIIPLFYEAERLGEWEKDLEARFEFAINFGKWKGFIREGDPVIAVNGSRRGSGNTDSLRIFYITKTEAGDGWCDVFEEVE